MAQIAHWKLDDWHSFLPVVVDSVGGYSGIASVNTSVLSFPGQIKSAFKFNGTSHSVVVTDNIALRIGIQDFTLNCWVKFPIIGSTYAGIISKGFSDAFPAGSWGLCASVIGERIRWTQATNAGGATGANFQSEPQTLGWHMVTIQRNGNIVGMYIDGKFYYQDSSAGNDLDTNANIKFGINEGGVYTACGVDDIRFYVGSYLTAVEILALYVAGKGRQFGNRKWGW